MQYIKAQPMMSTLNFVKIMSLLKILMHISIPCVNKTLSVKKIKSSIPEKDLKIFISWKKTNWCKRKT